MKVSRKSYVGEVINGFKILEEIQQPEKEYANSQIRHNNRLFRCLHLDSGISITRTLICLRNTNTRPPIDTPEFVDRSGEVFGRYKILYLTETSRYPRVVSGKSDWSYIIEDINTGETKEVSGFQVERLHERYSY